MKEAIIGLDIGTTSAKAALFLLTGQELATAESTYGVTSPQPGWCEQDPQQVWRAVVDIVAAIVKNAGPEVRPVGLAVASQSGSLVPADANGIPIYPCITWMDGRTEAIVDAWNAEEAHNRVRAISGWHIHPGLPLATIAWLRGHNPDVFGATQRWMCMNDYIAFKLSGQFATNPSNGGVTQLMEAASPCWSTALCDLIGARPEQFSPVFVGGAVIGPITAEVCAMTGLPAGMPVISGGHDQSCTALALGVMQPGQVLLACGTSWVVTGVVTQPKIFAVPQGMDLNYHAIPDRWTISQSLGGLGASLEWLVNQCWGELPDRAQRYAALDVELQETRPGSDGLIFLPMSGGHAAPASMQRGGFINLHLGHGRAHLARAVLESAAYELRLALDNIARGGLRTDTLWMFGGATRSSVWPDIVANVVELPLRVTPSAHLPAVGAAILASLGIHAFNTVEDAQRCFALPVLEVNPDPIRTAIYKEHFITYRKSVVA